MGNLTPNQVQSDIAKGIWKPNIYLTNMSTAYFQSDEDYVADKIFPLVPVMLSSANYYKFSKEDLARDNMQRKPEFGKVTPALMGQSEDTYSCKVDQIIVGIDQIQALNYGRTNAPGVADPRRSKVRFAVEQTKIHLDRLFGDGFFKTGVWGTEWEGKTTTPGTQQFYQFDDANSDPIKLIDDLCVSIRQKGRRKPNRLALGAETFVAIKNNAAVLDRIKYSGASANPANVNEKTLAELFNIEKVVVLNSTYNAGDIGETDMKYICDSKAALLCYAANAPSIDEPSAGYIFSWDMLGNQQPIAMTQYLGEPGTHSEFIEGLMAYDMKKTGDDLAVFLKSCVS